MPAVSDTLICNLALSMIGSARILSMGDQTPESEACLLHYDMVRDEVLRLHPWNFAIKRTTLTESDTDPLYGWAIQYELPEDCLRVLAVNDVNENQDPPRWVVEGKKLLTNDDSARIRYIFRNTNCAQYDVTFVQALAVRLSAVIAKRITNSDTIAAQQYQLFEAEYGPNARLTDLKESRPKVVPPWVRSGVVKARGQGWPRHDWGDFIEG